MVYAVAVSADTLKIESIVAGGDGLARHPDGFVVFVAGTAPGEQVAVEYTETQKQWRRARVVEVIEPSPRRREPPCTYYGTCGGCQLQHLEYDAQVEAKAGIIADALRRIAKLEPESDDGDSSIDVEPAPREFGYRNRVSFELARGDETVRAGFHRRDDATSVVDIEACPLAEPAINEAWKSLRAAWGPNATMLPAGPELRLTLRATSEGHTGLAVEGGFDAGEPARLVETVPQLAATWVLGRKGEPLGFAGAEKLTERWAGVDLPLSGTAFVQVNREMAVRLDEYTRQQCDVGDGARVVDAYCGYGVRALDLSRAGYIVVGIDFDRGAVRAARRIARNAELSAEFITGRVESSLGGALPADVVVLNPPRRGVVRAVVDALLQSPPERIVYVSCDPATLARDLRALSSAFDVTAVRGFDLFPQTASVETVATLIRR